MLALTGMLRPQLTNNGGQNEQWFLENNVHWLDRFLQTIKIQLAQGKRNLRSILLSQRLKA